MIQFLLTGTILGLSAGFAPGPLLTLVIAETLKHDMKEGIKIALTPLITDLPIILLTLFLLSRLSDFDIILGVISMLGGCLVLYLGIESIRTKGVQLKIDNVKPQSLKKGIIVNALSPHPYLFWFAVGAPTVIESLKHSICAAIVFVVSFYALLSGSKIILALITSKFQHFLTGKIYILIMRLLGVCLCFFSFTLFLDGLKRFNFL